MPCGYDNADMESWGHSFNFEAIHGERFLTRTAAKYQMFEYIEVYYLCPWVQSQMASLYIRLCEPVII